MPQYTRYIKIKAIHPSTQTRKSEKRLWKMDGEGSRRGEEAELLVGSPALTMIMIVT